METHLSEINNGNMKLNLLFILFFTTVFINACSQQKIICVKSYNESNKQEELLKLKEPNIYCFNLRDSSDTIISQIYLRNLQHVLNFYGKDKSVLGSKFSIIKPNPVELVAFEKYLTDSAFDMNDFYFLKVYSDNHGCLIYHGLIVKKRDFCKYVNFVTKLKEKEETILGTPTNGEIEIKDQDKIEKLIERSFFLIYKNDNYEYIEIGKNKTH
jgi:hypothetical protein